MKSKNGDGHVERTKSGKYSCTIDTGYPPLDIYKNEDGNKRIRNKRVKKTADTREEAIRLAKLAAKVHQKEWEERYHSHIKPSMLFSEACNEWFTKEKKDELTGTAYHTYYQSYKQYVEKYAIAKTQIHSLNKKKFQDYYDTLSLKYAPKTVATPVLICKWVCGWLVDRSYLEENYAELAKVKYEIPDGIEYVKKEDHKKLFTEEDMKLLLNAFHNGGVKSEYIAVVLFLCETGLRPQEFACLENKDIDFEKKRIFVYKTRAQRYIDETYTKTEYYTKVTKTKEQRYVPMSALAVDTVRCMQDRTRIYCKENPLDLLYPSFKTKKARSNETMETGFKNLCDLLGIDRDVHRTRGGALKGMNMYGCRHTCETMLKKAGMDRYSIAAMLGHKPSTGDAYYTHYTIADVEKGFVSPFSMINLENNDEKIHISVDEIEEKIIENESNTEERYNKVVKEIELFDKLFATGKITQEEYTLKRKQLLGI